MIPTMPDQLLSEDLLAVLRKVDTPTVCNAIEVVQGQRGFDRFTKGTMQHSKPGDPAIVGFARTKKIAGTVPTTQSDEVIRARRMTYFRSMASGPFPSVAVVEDIDYPNCLAGWWGEVHVAVHKGFGMRDLDVIDEDFPVLAGSIGVSHFHVRVEEIGTPVKVFGLDVVQGELIHADRHGAVVIPVEVIPKLKAGIDTVVSNEAIILSAAREADFDIEKLEQAWAEFEPVRT